ncbi:hypothetical protein WJX73_001991 [Symbiochloris irregularis]|uniref:Glutathione peroxidase n=1 Tax=Symbiochloris irregularis TaxID=706552 RepID=A0AAW1PT26_9CHLO
MLYEKYHDDGFELIGFPCNQFGGQAPGTSQEERDYAFGKFGFEFPVMDKIDVNGDQAHPLYRFLKERQPGSGSIMTAGGEKGKIEWNYVKFLVGRDGQPMRRYGPQYDPSKFEDDVRLLLAGKDPLPLECRKKPGLIKCNVDKLLKAQ